MEKESGALMNRKSLFYSVGLVLAMLVTMNGFSVNNHQITPPQIVNADTTDSEGVIYGAPAEIDSQQEAEDSSLLPVPQNSPAPIIPTTRAFFAKQVRSGTASNANKTSVTRSSTGFKVANPSAGVKNLEMSWVTDVNEIGISVSNAFYINTPISLSIELEKPLDKGSSIDVPVYMTGKIFNTSSSAEVSSFRSNPYVGQNNGNYYESPDHSFSYDYSESTGMLKITALTNAENTKFEGITYFLESKGSPWVPVPLNCTPYPLSGGVVGNYGEKGSGGTMTVKVGNQSTSETVTNLEETNFSDKLESQGSAIVNTQNATTTTNARSSNNFLAVLSTVLSQTNTSGSGNLLDGSYDHYAISATTNSDLADLAKKDPYKALRFEAYTPMGSITTNKVNVAVIFAGSNPSDFPAFKNVFKNAKYDDSKKTIEFDLSRDPKDWSNLAKALLAIPKGGSYYDRVQISYVKSYLQAMEKDDDKIGDTLAMHLYPVSPTTGFEPINSNNTVTATAVITNAKNKKTVTKIMNVKPVTAGNASSTQTTIAVQTADSTTGKSIGDGITYQYKSINEKWDITPPEIKGYAYVSTNDEDLLNKIGITGIATTGTVTKDMIGETENILFAYTNQGTVTAHFVNSEGKELSSKVLKSGTDGTLPKFTVPEIQKYELDVSPDIPSFKAGKNIDINYIYKQKPLVAKSPYKTVKSMTGQDYNGAYVPNGSTVKYDVKYDFSQFSNFAPTSGQFSKSVVLSDDYNKLIEPKIETLTLSVVESSGKVIGTLPTADYKVSNDTTKNHLEVTLTNSDTTQGKTNGIDEMIDHYAGKDLLLTYKAVLNNTGDTKANATNIAGINYYGELELTTNEVTTTLDGKGGKLVIDRAPTLDFGVHPIEKNYGSVTFSAFATKDLSGNVVPNYLQVADGREGASGWSVDVQESQEGFVTSKGETLTGAKITFGADGKSSVDSEGTPANSSINGNRISLSQGVATKIFSADSGTGNALNTMYFGAKNGSSLVTQASDKNGDDDLNKINNTGKLNPNILLTLPSGSANNTKERYSTTLLWTLNNTP